ncbi:MAG TPA: PIN domain-containing protein [Chloroflexota bacterium]|nr:PIN domain-containing protein [Chloroflexota bacterium]
MTLTRDSLLFFDASCLIAAAASPSGGSGFLLSVCQAGFLKACSSASVLLEAERNIAAKLPAAALATYHLQIAAAPLVLVSTPSRRSIHQHGPVFGEDAHVVASVLAAQAPYLLTLDRPLIQQIVQAGLPLIALTPGDFIQTVLPGHPDFAAIR